MISQLYFLSSIKNWRIKYARARSLATYFSFYQLTLSFIIFTISSLVYYLDTYFQFIKLFFFYHYLATWYLLYWLTFPSPRHLFLISQTFIFPPLPRNLYPIILVAPISNTQIYESTNTAAQYHGLTSQQQYNNYIPVVEYWQRFSHPSETRVMDEIIQHAYWVQHWSAATWPQLIIFCMSSFP